MRFPFARMPCDRGLVPRPMVDLLVAGSEELLLPCLVDTGSSQNRFGLWVAEETAIDLHGVESVLLGLGSPWPFGYQLLGLEGFFRWFDVTIRAADLLLEVDPIDQ